MAKILRLKNVSGAELNRRKSELSSQMRVPANAVRASLVRQFLTCGKKNCRCQRGLKHGPFHYLVQCMGVGSVRKFLLKTPEQREQARISIAAYAELQERLEVLSQINTELLRRGLEIEG
jgi:uncharacterized protein DUF6788